MTTKVILDKVSLASVAGRTIGQITRGVIKMTEMLVVSFRGVKCRFWSHLGCLGRASHYILISHLGIARIFYARVSCQLDTSLCKFPQPPPRAPASLPARERRGKRLETIDARGIMGWKERWPNLQPFTVPPSLHSDREAWI